MIKICSPQLGISPVSSLGGEIYDYQTLKGFTRKGFKVFVYLPKNREYDKSLKNFILTFAPIKHVFPPWLYSFLVLPYLFSLYKKEKFDILRVHSAGFLGLGAYIFHFFYPDVPILSNAVTVDSPGIYYPIEKWVYLNSKAIIVQSDYMKKVLIKKYRINNRKKIHVTYGGKIDRPVKFITRPQEVDLISPQANLLVFMGAMIKRKNPQFALEVFIELKKKLPQTKMLFIGQGKERVELIKMVDKYDLKSEVIFIDKAYGDQKNFWFSRMNLFLCPSLDEGFGLVVTEAMSFGKVVITSNKAAFSEIIQNGKDGFCLRLNKNEWAGIALKVLKNPKLAVKIGNGAKQKANQKFNWEKTYGFNAEVVKNMI